MGRAAPDLGGDTVRVALGQLPLLTSRLHIDLARVRGATGSPDDAVPARP
ncbi:hypothetical protein ACPCIX_04040 [Streptomyces pseudogriseolus]|nr:MULTISPECIES: hypothetical protein [Streptomyces]